MGGLFIGLGLFLLYALSGGGKAVTKLTPRLEPGDEPGSASQRLAALALRLYLEQADANWGTKNAPSKNVRNAQTAMGGVKVDGIVGPKTRDRAHELGQTIPPRGVPAAPTAAIIHQGSSPAAKPSATLRGGSRVQLVPGASYRVTLSLSGLQTLASNDQVQSKIQKTVGPWSSAKVSGEGVKRIASGVYNGAARSVVLPPEVTAFEQLGGGAATHTATAPKAPKAPTQKSDAIERAAALVLRKYLETPGANFGSKAKPSTQVATAQRAMGGGLVVDGIHGTNTAKRALQLGQTLPTRPKSAAAPKLVATSVPPFLPTATAPARPAPPLLPTDTRTAAKPATAKPATAKPSSTAPVDVKPTAAQRQAAFDLRVYMGSSGANWGSKANPSARVEALQTAMGSTTADGIVGSITRARAALLGQALPTSRTSTPAPSTPASYVSTSPGAAKPPVPSSAQNNARALDAYLASGARDRARVAGFQWALGLDADGVPGAMTRAEVQRVIGTAPKWAALTSAQMSGPIPGGATAREAAERLERYAKVGGKTAARVAAYQKVLGVKADGAIGKDTRAAASKALGRTVAF